MSAVMAEPIKRLHLPAKALGDNFYPFMYGMHRAKRIQAIAKARLSHGPARAEYVMAARKLNHECVWYLRRTNRSLP